MQEDELPAGPVDEGEPWVTRTPAIAQRVPGIDEAHEATYVDPENGEKSAWLRPALIGTGIGLVVTAVFAAIVLSSDTDGNAGDSAIGAGTTASSSSTRSSTTTTSTTTTTTSTTTAPAPPAAPPATAVATPPPFVAPPAAVPPPTPRATANPAQPVYTQVPLPAGVSATLSSCAWHPTNGGQYEASGTVTNGPSTNHGWTLTIHWLQNDREIGAQYTLVPLTAGQSAPWSMTLSAPTAPADPFSCALTAA